MSERMIWRWAVTIAAVVLAACLVAAIWPLRYEDHVRGEGQVEIHTRVDRITGQVVSSEYYAPERIHLPTHAADSIPTAP